jgi:hypothetical protein
MFLFFLIIALSLALLYAYRKRIGFVARLLEKMQGLQEHVSAEPTDTTIKIDEMSQEIKKLNQLVSALPDQILSELRKHLSKEREWRVELLTEREEMKKRLENFDALVRAFKPPRNRPEIGRTETGSFELSQAVTNESAVGEYDYEVQPIATEISITPAPPVVSAVLSSDLEEFVNQNIEHINQAGYHGLRGIRGFIESSEVDVELHSPSDGILVLTEREAGPCPEGRAFVLPGQLLGRPWVEWFEVPRELVHPIEATVCPAIVFGRNDGTWELRKKGRVSQQ